MNIVRRALAIRATYGPGHDFWYQPVGSLTGAGVRVDADTALKVSAVYACVRLIAETLAGLPLPIYRQISDDERQTARQHPIHDLLTRRPNRVSTAIDFRQLLTTWALLRGNGYAELVDGPRGPVDQLVPINPDHVTIERLAGGVLRYQVTEPGRAGRSLLDDEVFHLRGLTLDGVSGLSLISYMRETVGAALAQEQYGARVFSQAGVPPLVLKMTGQLSEPAAKRLRQQWQEMHSGLQNAHKVAVLEQGMEPHVLGMTAEDAQLIESRSFQASDIARWFGVPPHMIGLVDRSTSWGSGIEQQSIGFVTYTLLPWAKRWEQAISRDLIVADDLYYAEHNFAGMLRADTQTRYQAYATARQWGWLSVNDIRRLENQNPIPGGDTYLQPLNMALLGSTPAPAPSGEPPASAVHYGLLLEETAGRVARRETAGLKALAKRTDLDAPAYASELATYYAEHAQYVASALQVPPAVAGRYAEHQRDLALRGGTAALLDWQSTATPELIRLAREYAS